MKKVLIIEDESALQDALGNIFDKSKYQVLQAFDGEEGLAMAESEIPDIVLLDLILPKKHGFDVLHEIKSSDKLKHIPVLVLTNLEESEDVMRAIELGARGYLVKANYALKEVLEKVREIIG